MIDDALLKVERSFHEWTNGIIQSKITVCDCESCKHWEKILKAADAKLSQIVSEVAAEEFYNPQKYGNHARRLNESRKEDIQ